jgi:hypothetical protein
MGTGKCHFRFVVKQDIQDIAIVHIVMKESLNSDGQQFHQYQQNKQSPLIRSPAGQHTEGI